MAENKIEGKRKYIETPEKMWDYFEAYAQLTKSNPFKVQDYVGKDGIEVYRLRERPLTMEGFDNYLFKNKIINDVSHYFSNEGGRYEAYIGICSRIRKAIRNDQIEGGMCNVYNTSITQRLNGLVEKSEQQVTVNNVNANFGTTLLPASKSGEDTQLD